jgi:PAS domain S-box-containing protein
VLIDKDANILTCNQSTIDLFGLSSKEDIKRIFIDFTPDYQPNGRKSKEFAEEMIKQAFETGRVFIDDCMHMSLQGELLPCEVTLVRVEYGGEQVIAAYIRDMRELRASTAKMREADARAQIMFEASPFACCMFDDMRKVIDCNQETVNLFAIPDKEFFIENFFTSLFPQYQPNGELSVDVSSANARTAFEKSYHRFKCMHKKLNGEPLPVEVTMVRVMYKDSYTIAAYFRDLTEQIAAEQLTKLVMEQTSTLTAILDTTPDMIFVKDLESRYTLCNKSFERHFNFPRDEIIGKSDADGLKVPPEIAAEFALEDKKIYADKGVIMFEDYIYSHDGTRVLFETLKAPLIVNGEVTGLVGIARDITQRKELARQQAEAEAANKAKSSFLASMSHEIRTPMNAILGITEIQLQKDGLLADTKNALNIIYNSGYSLLGIINNLLDLSKIEAGKLELASERYETASLINDTININTARIGSKPIEFKLHVNSDVPFELIGDELRIRQILNNLLSNAIKYTESGEVNVSFLTEITNVENAPGVKLAIAVRDTGQGMTEEQLKKLFDAYSRFNTDANRFVEGTGLGMNIVQHLVNAMGGEISVNSVPGEGTEVTVYLPQGYAGPAKLGDELAENLMGFSLAGISKMKNAQIAREHMPYGKVLVVDDMETNLYVARGFLVPYGLTVETALSGMEAIKKLDSGEDYDIIFMDHMMPVMDGIKTVQLIREKGYTLPIVALTANAVTGQAEIFLANGFNGFISKPIDIRELNAALNKFVRDRKPPEVVEAARAAQSNAAQSTPPAAKVPPGLAKVFIRDAEKAGTILKTYEGRGVCEHDDLRGYIINAHALKSALANIGETQLSARAAELEQAGRDRNAIFISDETPAFLSALWAVMDRLRPKSGNNDLYEVSGEDKLYMREQLLIIKDACAVYDMDSAKNALAALNQKPWPDAYNELLEAIAEYLLRSDFEDAEAVCASYLS